MSQNARQPNFTMDVECIAADVRINSVRHFFLHYLFDRKLIPLNSLLPPHYLRPREFATKNMKIAAATTLVLVASASAFAPAPSNGRVSVACDSLADRIFGMDLFAPVKEQNDYGARGKKNLKVGKLSDNSYVPAGLTKAQYEKIRGAEKKKKDDNYQRNVKKAGIFTDYTDFYLKRGTDLQGDWKKTVGVSSQEERRSDVIRRVYRTIRANTIRPSHSIPRLGLSSFSHRRVPV